MSDPRTAHTTQTVFTPPPHPPPLRLPSAPGAMAGTGAGRRPSWGRRWSLPRPSAGRGTSGWTSGTPALSRPLPASCSTLPPRSTLPQPRDLAIFLVSAFDHRSVRRRRTPEPGEPILYLLNTATGQTPDRGREGHHRGFQDKCFHSETLPNSMNVGGHSTPDPNPTPR